MPRYCRGAEQGHATAQFNLGLMYAQGEGVPQDSREGVAWIRRAAEQGEDRALAMRVAIKNTWRGIWP